MLTNLFRRPSAPFVATLLAPLTIALAGCGAPPQGIKIDGSSTVYPISEAVAEKYSNENPGARVTVGFSGTGGGMKKFIAGEIDICDASRGMKQSEADACAQASVGFIELTVAFDGLAVITNPENDWCDCLTVEQLASIWRPDSPVNKWNELDPAWPDEEIKLYGPGTDSGTFDYFTEVIVGESKSSRPDYTASEDDNVLVTGISEDKYALGYFGFAYYIENKEKLKLLSVDDGDGNCVKPTIETVMANTYKPLSRPLFVYVRNSTLARPEGKKFVQYYLDNAADMATVVGYVPVSEDIVAQNLESFNGATSGE
ncbi:Phosphate-binding protein PstS precursor [Pseudobythopirellula maris]|uniref:Phosphate-binding protein n=1 Tax=Pseudobythopirellula maris TaxID=2527991 RepID=A0A5C5ZUL4_9BACT|nr:PstS family phosphate ABC transporter substrate-binding protein [Pseudobythopirellula maris]TWT89883.1 Phosphate-binding protein PstS precursor [Pseudobythopirellula maris]